MESTRKKIHIRINLNSRVLCGVFIFLLTTSYFLLTVPAFAGSLSCTIRSTACSAGEVAIFNMYTTSNSHAELASQSNYTNLVCCGGYSGIGNSCSGNYQKVLNLYASTNSHVEETSQSNYSNYACLSSNVGDVITVGYGSGSCSGYDTTLASISGVTNAHVGSTTAYNTRVCATVVVAVISVSVSDGTVAYGTVANNSQKSTIDLSDTQVATNDGTGAEDFNIKTSTATGGTAWSLGSSAGSDTFVHEVSTSSGSTYVKFATANVYQGLATNVSAAGTKNVDLRITTPTASTDLNQKTITVTVQAVAH